jgi:hypothetical protein
MEANPFCLSSYLAFRYVADPDEVWRPGVRPEWPQPSAQARAEVQNAESLVEALRASLLALTSSRVGLLLSGGMDSAILAALVPRGTAAYSLRFVADGALDESAAARRFAERCGLSHQVIDARWDDYLRALDELMARKRSPLHAVEPALFLAAQRAYDDGIRVLVVGNGADSTFGGLDKLLSRDWTYPEFMARYSFVDPQAVLSRAVPVERVFAPYRRGDGVDVVRFVADVHGRGIIQAFDNAVGAAGCRTAQPYEALRLAAPLDLARIRRGESKYLVRQAFAILYPGLEAPEKLAFARPMDRWLSGWGGPRRPEFRSDLELGRFSGEQRWLLFCLERFLDLLDRRAQEGSP